MPCLFFRNYCIYHLDTKCCETKQTDCDSLRKQTDCCSLRRICADQYDDIYIGINMRVLDPRIITRMYLRLDRVALLCEDNIEDVEEDLMDFDSIPWKNFVKQTQEKKARRTIREDRECMGVIWLQGANNDVCTIFWKRALPEIHSRHLLVLEPFSVYLRNCYWVISGETILLPSLLLFRTFPCLWLSSHLNCFRWLGIVHVGQISSNK